MQSKILESIGIDPAYILIVMFLILIILGAFLVSLNMKYNRLKRSYSRFMRGSDGKTLEDNIRRHLEEMERIEELSGQNQMELRSLKEKISGSIQKTGLVQYTGWRRQWLDLKCHAQQRRMLHLYKRNCERRMSHRTCRGRGGITGTGYVW